MSHTDPRSGRYRPLIPDSDVRAAARRVAAGESLRKVAADIGYTGSSGHRALKRRIDALAARAARDQVLRDEARALRRTIPEANDGSRPEALPGERVATVSALDAEMQRATDALLDRNARRAAERSAREADEISSDEYWTQRVEAREVETGRTTAASVLEARRLGRPTLSRDATRSRLHDLLEDGTARPSSVPCFSAAENLAMAFTGRPPR